MVAPNYFTVQELRTIKKSFNVEKEPRMVIENSQIEVRIFSLVVKLFVNHHVLSAHIMKIFFGDPDLELKGYMV